MREREVTIPSIPCLSLLTYSLNLYPLSPSFPLSLPPHHAILCGCCCRGSAVALACHMWLLGCLVGRSLNYLPEVEDNISWILSMWISLLCIHHYIAATCVCACAAGEMEREPFIWSAMILWVTKKRMSKIKAKKRYHQSELISKTAKNKVNLVSRHFNRVNPGTLFFFFLNCRFATFKKDTF